MKKQLSTICLLLMLILAACLACTVVSAEAVDGVYGDLAWSFDTETGILEISGDGVMPNDAAPWLAYRGDIRSVTVSEGVTRVGRKAFENCKALADVQLPEGIAVIEASAFSGCTALLNIELPSTLETVGNSAFSGSGLCSVTVPEGVKKLSTGAFSGCKSLESVSLPNTLTTMDVQAFFGCAALQTIEIPESLTALSAQVFANCSSLTEVELPDTLEAIHSMAFSNCTSLKKIKLPESLREVYTNAFAGCDGLLQTVGGLKYVDNWLVGYDKASPVVNAIIREGTIGVASSALKGVGSLTSVYVPRELVCIGNSAFEGCDALTSVRIEDGSKLTVIGDKAFYHCSKLANVALVKKAGGSVGGNFELPIIPTEGDADSVVTLPEALTSIGVSAFEGCASMKAAVVPAGVTELSERLFFGCTSLKTLTLPVLSRIDKQALSGCGALETVYFVGDQTAFDAVEKAADWNDGAGEYALELHTAHEGGKATCAKSARCTICGQWYGEKDTASHGKTELVGNVAATCGETGYTGDYCCVDCGDVVTVGEEIPATGAHTGGKANCTSPAVCEVCGNSYGEIDKTVHTGNTKIEKQKDETCGEAGYTGDLHCADCGELLIAGEEIPATGEHTGGEADSDGNAICEVCGDTYKPYIRGDVNADKTVTAADAVHCLRHILFPAKFEVNQGVDFDGDGKEDANDAVYLLRHVLFPSKFPLA